MCHELVKYVELTADSRTSFARLNGDGCGGFGSERVTYRYAKSPGHAAGLISHLYAVRIIEARNIA